MRNFDFCLTNRGRLQPTSSRNLVQVAGAIAVALVLSHLLQTRVYAATSDGLTSRPNIVLIMADDNDQLSWKIGGNCCEFL
jgi:hypothetical protein